ELSRALTERLQDWARGERLTGNTIVQGAWAILLGRYSGQPEVVYGATTSGRPVELKGGEEMVGLVITTLPGRVDGTGDWRVADWLRELQKQQAESRQYEYSPLAQVQSWSGVERGTPLFESIVVFENYPVASVFEGLPRAASNGGKLV